VNLRNSPEKIVRASGEKVTAQHTIKLEFIAATYCRPAASASAEAPAER